MEQQEAAARHEWSRAINEGYRMMARDENEHFSAWQERVRTAATQSCRELVALGFVDPRDESVVWYALPNVAGAGEFRVEPEDVERVYMQAMEELTETELVLGNASAQRSMITVDASSWVCILWHSHYATQHPSMEDIAELANPVNSWIDYGMIFHAPSGVTTLYNSGGIIEPKGTISSSVEVGGDV